MSAKDLRLDPIPKRVADSFVRRWHYSGRVDPRSQLHVGVFCGGVLHGAMQLGPSIAKAKVQGLVKDTPWNGWLDLHRVALDDTLPRNSESRSLSVLCRMVRRHHPSVQWILTYADACQCGDGAIYRAAGALLTGIVRNSTMWRMPDGRTVADIVFRMGGRGPNSIRARYGMGDKETTGQMFRRVGARRLSGYQIRYIFPLDPTVPSRLTVPILPYSDIARIGASMYRGQRASEPTSVGTGVQPGEGGATPTRTLIEGGE